jgi:hypothetical protein
MKTFYIDNNQFDATRKAANSEEALKSVFGATSRVNYIGIEGDSEFFYVVDDEGEEHEVFVTETSSGK